MHLLIDDRVIQFASEVMVHRMPTPVLRHATKSIGKYSVSVIVERKKFPLDALSDGFSERREVTLAIQAGS